MHIKNMATSQILVIIDNLKNTRQINDTTREAIIDTLPDVNYNGGVSMAVVAFGWEIAVELGNRIRENRVNY